MTQDNPNSNNHIRLDLMDRRFDDLEARFLEQSNRLGNQIFNLQRELAQTINVTMRLKERLDELEDRLSIPPRRPGYVVFTDPENPQIHEFRDPQQSP